MNLKIPILYAFLTSLATIGGGLLPRLRIFSKLDSRYLIGFAAGAMVSIAFFDMLPEIETDYMIWVAVGFFSIYLIEKFILLHSCAEDECEYHSVGWPAMVGVAAESLIDGIAIAVGYSVSSTLGIFIALAVILHEVPRGFTTTIIMQHAGKSKLEVWFALLIDAGFTPLGALLGMFVPEDYFMALLGFAVGTFIYVGAADLLPEAHKKFNKWVVVSVIFGVILIYLISSYLHFE